MFDTLSVSLVRFICWKYIFALLFIFDGNTKTTDFLVPAVLFNRLDNGVRSQSIQETCCTFITVSFQNFYFLQKFRRPYRIHFSVFLLFCFFLSVACFLFFYTLTPKGYQLSPCAQLNGISAYLGHGLNFHCS